MISAVIRKKCTREFFKVFIHWIRAILTVFEKLTCALMFFPNCTSNQITYTIIYQLYSPGASGIPRVQYSEGAAR